MRVHSGQEAVIPTELVARLEVASEGSRELDAEVYAAVTEGDWKATSDGWIETTVRAMATTRVTASLDCALALAERVLVAPYVGPISLTIAGSGQAYIDHVDPCGQGVGSFGNTPALALCLAILKATTASAVGTDERSEGVNP